MSTRWRLFIGGLAAASAVGVGSVAFAGNGDVACGCAPAVVDTVVDTGPDTGPDVPIVPSTAGTISVSGTGSISVEPDTAVVNLGIQGTAPTGAEALGQVNTDATALTEALVAAGIAEDDIQTSGLSLYSTTGDDGSSITGYNASLTVNVTVRDIEAVGPTIDAAQQAGGEGFTIGGVSFSFSDPESVLEQARIDALANARAKAEQYAAAAGVQLGTIVSISEGTSSPPILYAAADMAAAPESGPPISPGQLDLTIDISVTFAID